MKVHISNVVESVEFRFLNTGDHFVLNKSDLEEPDEIYRKCDEDRTVGFDGVLTSCSSHAEVYKVTIDTIGVRFG